MGTTICDISRLYVKLEISFCTKPCVFHFLINMLHTEKSLHLQQVNSRVPEVSNHLKKVDSGEEGEHIVHMMTLCFLC